MEEETTVVDEQVTDQSTTTPTEADIEDMPLSPEGDDEFNSDDDSDDADDSHEDGSQDEDSEQEDTDPSQMTDEQRKEHNRVHMEQRLAAKQQADQRNAAFLGNLREEVMKAVPEVDESRYEELADELGEDSADVQRRLDMLEYREQQQQAEAAIQQVESQRNFIGMNIAQAEAKIPLFNEASPEYNQTLHEAVLSDWAAANLETVTDRQGNTQILGMRQGAVSPEQYMQEKAKMFGEVLQISSARGQANAQKNRKAGESPYSSTSSKSRGNSLDALEERIGDISLSS